MSFKLVVAGATGALGGAVVELAKQRGWQVTVLGRSREKLAELGAHDAIVISDLDKNGGLTPELVERLRGHDCVFSCLGASVHPNAGGSRTYTQVDTPCNRALIEATKQAKVPKFVYVSLANAKPLLHLDYVKAHEEVVAALKSSGLNYAVVRPTGFFSAFAPIFEMARKGAVPLMGTPEEAKTNPIDDRDLAEVCLEAVESDFGDQEVGGPEVLSRLELVERAFAALGKPVKTRKLPDGVVHFMSTLIKPFNPRLANITKFYLAVSREDCVAPVRGSRSISDYFGQLA